MEKIDQQSRAESRTRAVTQIRASVRSGDYSRAADLLRQASAEFPGDAELSELEKLAQDGAARKDEADRLITESQELFAQQKSAEAIQLLRKAHELDKTNTVNRAILANALVEHAQSMVDSDWLGAETLTNQALALNPAHPTAKTILNQIVGKKEKSSVDDWVGQARKLQSSGDLFAALAWVAEGLAVHPHDPKLLQIQDEVQRDQEARRRQARRGDLEDLRRMQREIDGTKDVAAKQALAERIQGVAAKYWTDGEILSIANALLLRLGLVSQESSSGSARGKGGTVILHVPRPNGTKPTRAAASQAPVSAAANPAPASPVTQSTTLASESVQSPPVASKPASQEVEPKPVPAKEPAAEVVARKGVLRTEESAVQAPVVPLVKAPKPAPASAASSRSVPITRREVSAPTRAKPAMSQQKQTATGKGTTLIVVGGLAAIVLVAATFFFTRRHYAAVEKSTAAAPAVSAAAPSQAPVSAPAVSAPEVPAPVPGPAEVSAEPSEPPVGSAMDSGRAAIESQPVAASGANVGTLVVVAGQDDAKISVNGKPLRQLTRGGQLRIPNLELKEYVVQVSKSGFQDPPQQKIRVRKGEEAKLVFNLQPQVRMASLAIAGGAPGTAVLVDQAGVGSIQSDGTLSVNTINPGDHTVELRKERFKPRQFKRHFVAGGMISLAAADAVLEALPSELKITFSPPDATVAVVKGDLLKMVTTGVPLSLAPGTYTLTARTAERFTRSAKIEIVAGQSKTLDLSLGPNGMSKWDNPGAWKHERDAFIRKGGDFVLYGVVPASGTFTFSAMATKGRVLQWVINYSDSQNYVLFQLDENNFSRAVIRNGVKADEIKVPEKGDKKSFRTIQIRVNGTEIVHQIKHGDSWNVVDRWSQPGTNLGAGRFGFYIPGSDEVSVSSFAHYADLNIR